MIYCWRGGQRSGSFATILQQVGWRAEVIDGGYRSYRRLVTQAMHDTPLRHRLVLLDGNTGTAKTDLLELLVAGQGIQTVDLEGLAAHRGSVFGAVATPQPSQKAFESALALALEALDPARPVLVEAESSKIGHCLIPPTVWAAMLAAPRIRVAAPLAARAEYLDPRLCRPQHRPRRAESDPCRADPATGPCQVEHWQMLADKGALQQLAAELMEQHYDPRYGKSRGRSRSDDHCRDRGRYPVPNALPGSGQPDSHHILRKPNHIFCL